MFQTLQQKIEEILAFAFWRTVRLGFLSCPNSMRVPYLARFSRDVGYANLTSIRPEGSRLDGERLFIRDRSTHRPSAHRRILLFSTGFNIHRFSPGGTAESSPGRSPGKRFEVQASPAGTAENHSGWGPGHNPGDFQPSLAGLVVVMCKVPRTASWATLSRPSGTKAVNNRFSRRSPEGIVCAPSISASTTGHRCWSTARPCPS